MIIKVSTPNDHWYTGFNGTIEEAVAYFLGQTFETTFGNDLPVTLVEQVKP